MFTGIVEEVGTVRSVRPKAIEIAAVRVLEGTRLGDSIAVNGACLTVAALTPATFTVEVTPETLRRTDLGDLRPGSRVNLERALTPSSRMGGHFVQGHVDATGVIVDRRPEENAVNLRFEAPPEVMRYVVRKGFIAVDGISLTVVDCDDETFSVTLIPFTQENVALLDKSTGDRVNLEGDILGKYLERFLTYRRPRPEAAGAITEQMLSEHGLIKDRG